MANKNLFKSKKSSALIKKSKSLVFNEAGGLAYSLDDKAALAQYAMTGTLNSTFYASEQDQLNKVIELSKKCDPEFIAKLAVYSRQKGSMKDMPALLTAIVAARKPELLSKFFNRAIDNPKMLRNFVQILRSGVTGRVSLGTAPKKLIQKYLNNLSDEQVFKADIGNDPSLPDIIKLVHPKPESESRSALYGYLLDKQHDKARLPSLVKEFESFKKDLSKPIPNVPFQMLTALPLSNIHWKEIAKNATWNQSKKNLNTFMRHGVFTDNKMIDLVAQRLSDKDQIHKSKVFPYEMYTAFKSVDDSLPKKLTLALQDAAEYSTENIPSFKGKVFVMVDTSGSMSSPATGYRKGATSVTSCVEVAALFASAILRKNPEAEVIPFDTDVRKVNLNPKDSIMTNTKKLSLNGGGTDCSSALKYVNRNNANGDLVIYISDNQSWIDSSGTMDVWLGKKQTSLTPTMDQWKKFISNNPNAKLVNIDIVPTSTTPAVGNDVLNIAGFSDKIFDVIANFVEFGHDKNFWIKTIETVQL